MVRVFKARWIITVSLVLGMGAGTVASASAERATVSSASMRAPLLARNPLTLVYLGMVLSACRDRAPKDDNEAKRCCGKVYPSRAGALHERPLMGREQSQAGRTVPRHRGPRRAPASHVNSRLCLALSGDN